MNWERKVGSNTEIHQAKAAPKPSLAEERVKLALEDGTVIEGFSFGSKRVVRGGSGFQYSYERLRRNAHRSIILWADTG